MKKLLVIFLLLTNTAHAVVPLGFFSKRVATSAAPPAGNTNYLTITNELMQVFSTRLVVSNYAGALGRVRRSGDNAEMDVAFTVSNGEMDTNALLAFIGSSNGFWVTWYDQMGGSNMNSAAVANQPVIVTNGGLSGTINGHPGIRFCPGSGVYSIMTNQVGITNFSIFARVSLTSIQPSGDCDYGYIYSSVQTALVRGGGIGLTPTANKFQNNIKTVQSKATTTTTATNKAYLVEHHYDGATTTLALNGATDEGVAADTGLVAATAKIGSSYTTTKWLSGVIGEIFVYGAEQSNKLAIRHFNTNWFGVYPP